MMKHKLSLFEFSPRELFECFVEALVEFYTDPYTGNLAWLKVGLTFSIVLLIVVLCRFFYQLGRLHELLSLLR